MQSHHACGKITLICLLERPQSVRPKSAVSTAYRAAPMWWDIDRKAEAVMAAAERNIRSAEQAAYEPPWDGEQWLDFSTCGTVVMHSLVEHVALRVCTAPPAQHVCGLVNLYHRRHQHQLSCNLH
jgi:hypothetical protein